MGTISLIDIVKVNYNFLLDIPYEDCMYLESKGENDVFNHKYI